MSGPSARFAAVSRAVAAAGLDALFLDLPSRVNRGYLNGFRSSGILIIGADGASYFIIDGRYSELAAQRAPEIGYKVVEAENFAAYGPLLRQTAERAGYRKLGYEAHLTNVSRLDALRGFLGAEPIPAGQIIEDLRARKSAEEADKIEAAQRITERAFESILPLVRPGATERQIARELTIALYREGADELAFNVISLSGPNTSRPHGVAGDRPIEPGDFVMLDLGAYKDGYASDMTRTVAVGFATDEMRAVYDAVLQGQLAGIAAAKAGRTGHEVDAAARAVIEQKGYGPAFSHLLGHGVGMNQSEGPLLDVGEQDPLPEGAVFSVEPGIYLPGKFGVRIEDLVWLSPEGLRNLTRTPKELLILPAQ
jgi:Xaa-Pro aminopeptidase